MRQLQTCCTVESRICYFKPNTNLSNYIVSKTIFFQNFKLSYQYSAQTLFEQPSSLGYVTVVDNRCNCF